MTSNCASDESRKRYTSSWLTSGSRPTSPWLRLLLYASIMNLALCTRTAWTPQHFPDPTKSSHLCGNRGPSWVCDPNRVISKSQANSLQKLLLEIHGTKFTDCKGPVFAIAIVNRVLSSDGSWASEWNRKTYMLSFANYLRTRNWKHFSCLGTELTVIAVSVADRYTAVSTGTANKILTSDCIQTVLDKKIPNYKTATIYTFLKTQLEAYKEALDGNRDICRSIPEVLYYVIPIAFVILIIAVAACVCYCCCCRSNKESPARVVKRVCHCCRKQEQEETTGIPYVNMRSQPV